MILKNGKKKEQDQNSHLCIYCDPCPSFPALFFITLPQGATVRPLVTLAFFQFPECTCSVLPQGICIKCSFSHKYFFLLPKLTWLIPTPPADFNSTIAFSGKHSQNYQPGSGPSFRHYYNLLFLSFTLLTMVQYSIQYLIHLCLPN